MNDKSYLLNCDCKGVVTHFIRALLLSPLPFGVGPPKVELSGTNSDSSWWWIFSTISSAVSNFSMQDNVASRIRLFVTT